VPGTTIAWVKANPLSVLLIATIVARLFISWGFCRRLLTAVGVGLLLFFIAARTVQARLALTALPFLLFGIVLHVEEKQSRVYCFFPIVFCYSWRR
jgi:hypothetical protein